MKKTELNPNIHLSEGNIKSKCTDDVVFLTWSLPSRKCCPYATTLCLMMCFAKKNENFVNVRVSRERNFEETKKNTFVRDMINHLEYHLLRKKTDGKKVFVRIHTSGDFYCDSYFEKWVEISNHFKGNDKILFQAYTKSMPILYRFIYNDYDTEEYDNWVDEKSAIQQAKDKLKDINIHLVWSIWNDTPKEYTEFARKIGLQTFTALPKEEVEVAVTKGCFSCNGDCGNCKECYTGKSLEIVIPYH